MCDALGVSRSGFYAWLTRPSSKRRRDDQILGEQIRQSVMASDRIYGARRVWRDVLALGCHYGHHRIKRLMQALGLLARPPRRGLPKDAGARSAIAGNVLVEKDPRCTGPVTTAIPIGSQAHVLQPA